MIDEKFLKAAVNIRKTYLKMMGNLDKYHKKAEETLKILDDAYKKLDKLENDIKQRSSKGDEENLSSVEKLLEIISFIESEGNKLESFTNPINKEIEKLALEEQELYKQICLKHPDLKEEEIVNCVKERFIKENF